MELFLMAKIWNFDSSQSCLFWLSNWLINVVYLMSDGVSNSHEEALLSMLNIWNFKYNVTWFTRPWVLPVVDRSPGTASLLQRRAPTRRHRNCRHLLAARSVPVVTSHRSTLVPSRGFWKIDTDMCVCFFISIIVINYLVLLLWFAENVFFPLTIKHRRAQFRMQWCWH